MEGRRAALTILAVGMKAGDVGVLLGRNVVGCFGLEQHLSEHGWLSWHEVEGRMFLLVPHPSGLNRWWNDPDNEAAARRALGAVEAFRDGGWRKRQQRFKDIPSPYSREAHKERTRAASRYSYQPN